VPVQRLHWIATRNTESWTVSRRPRPPLLLAQQRGGVGAGPAVYGHPPPRVTKPRMSSPAPGAALASLTTLLLARPPHAGRCGGLGAGRIAVSAMSRRRLGAPSPVISRCTTACAETWFPHRRVQRDTSWYAFLGQVGSASPRAACKRQPCLRAPADGSLPASIASRASWRTLPILVLGEGSCRTPAGGRSRRARRHQPALASRPAACSGCSAGTRCPRWPRHAYHDVSALTRRWGEQVSAQAVVHRLRPGSAARGAVEDIAETHPTRTSAAGHRPGVVVARRGGGVVKLAKCCTRCGDDILGFVTRGGGVSVHRRPAPTRALLRQESVVESPGNVHRLVLVGSRWSAGPAPPALRHHRVLSTSGQYPLRTVSTTATGSRSAVHLRARHPMHLGHVLPPSARDGVYTSTASPRELRTPEVRQSPPSNWDWRLAVRTASRASRW